MNKILKHLRHELNHGDSKGYTCALFLALASLACWKKGAHLKDMLKNAMVLDFNERELVLTTLLKGFGREEFHRVEKLWDNYKDEDDDRSNSDIALDR